MKPGNPFYFLWNEMEKQGMLSPLLRIHVEKLMKPAPQIVQDGPMAYTTYILGKQDHVFLQSFCVV
ncbi:MAG: hypothetical protein CMB97_04005 [Flavobacteriaceae bacterium]|nr:hypothetical protein [Flavobacteriaceae bacterium]